MSDTERRRGPILSRISENEARRSQGRRRDRSSEFPTTDEQVETYTRLNGRKPSPEALEWSRRTNLPLNEAPSYLYNPQKEE